MNRTRITLSFLALFPIYILLRRKGRQRSKDDDRPLRGIYFGATGGLLMYSHGIASYLEDHFELEDLDFYGVSGGCQPSVFLSSKIGMFKALHQWFLPMINDMRDDGFYKYFSFPMPTGYLRSKRYLGRIMKTNPNYMKNVQGRLWLHYTTLRMKGITVGHYANFDELFDVIGATQYIPFLCGPPFMKHRARNTLCIDGYLTKAKLPPGRWLSLHPFKWKRFYPLQGLTSIRNLCNIPRQLELRKLGYEDARQHHDYFIEQGLKKKCLVPKAPRLEHQFS